MLLAHLLAALRRMPVLGFAWCPLAIALGTTALLLAFVLRPRHPEAMEDALTCAVLSTLGLMLLASVLPVRRAGEAARTVSASAAWSPRPSSAVPAFGDARPASAA